MMSEKKKKYFKLISKSIIAAQIWKKIYIGINFWLFWMPTNPKSS